LEAVGSFLGAFGMTTILMTMYMHIPEVRYHSSGFRIITLGIKGYLQKLPNTFKRHKQHPKLVFEGFGKFWELLGAFRELFY